MIARVLSFRLLIFHVKFVTLAVGQSRWRYWRNSWRWTNRCRWCADFRSGRTTWTNTNKQSTAAETKAKSSQCDKCPKKACRKRKPFRRQWRRWLPVDGAGNLCCGSKSTISGWLWMSRGLFQRLASGKCLSPSIEHRRVDKTRARYVSDGSDHGLFGQSHWNQPPQRAHSTTRLVCVSRKACVSWCIPVFGKCDALSFETNPTARNGERCNTARTWQCSQEAAQCLVAGHVQIGGKFPQIRTDKAHKQLEPQLHYGERATHHDLSKVPKSLCHNRQTDELLNVSAFS